MKSETTEQPSFFVRLPSSSHMASPVPPTAPPPPPSAPSPPSQPQVLRPQAPPAANPRVNPPRQYYPNPHSNPHAHTQGSFYPPPTKSTKETPALAFADSAQQYNRKFQGILDRITPYSTYRWLGTACLLALFFLRVVLGQGWYVVAYGLSIFLLNIFLAFLQPKFDPSLEADLQEQDIEEGGEAGSLGASRTDDLPTAGLGRKMMSMVGMNSPGLDADGEEEFKPFIRRLPGSSLFFLFLLSFLLLTMYRPLQ